MEKNKRNLLSLIVITAFVLSSCGGLNKMKENAGVVKYDVTPSPLEMHGGKVAVSITGKFPEKFFNKKAILEVTPVLKYEAGETALKAKSLQGEKVEANNPVIKYAEGGSFNYTDTIDYKEEMLFSELVIRAKASIGDNSVELPDQKIADGVISTAGMVDNNPKVILGADKFERITPETFMADIHYLIQRSSLRRSELTNEDIKKLEEDLEQAVKNERISFKNIGISSYASPDGPMDLNEKLSEGRKGSAKGYLDKEARRKGIEIEDENSFYETKTTTEDWDGFKKVVQESDIEDKDLILRVLSMYSDPEVREKELENMAATWEELAEDILPKLRRSELKVNVEVVGYSDDELKELVSSNPDTLKIEEILYAATLFDDMSKKLEIYKKAAANFTDDYRPQNNIGVVQIKMRNISEAKAAFEKAKSIEDNDIVNNNLGAVALKEGKLSEAQSLFESAQGAGDPVNFNLGTIKIMEGDYNAAINYFGNTCSANAGLAYLLQGNNQEAISKLGCIDEPGATAYYLKAVIGARTNDDNLVFPNLKSAIAENPELKERAKKDIEFAKYFDDETFQSTVR